MADAFSQFMADFFKALKGWDVRFLTGVYSDWFESSGVMPDRKIGEFLSAAKLDLTGMAGSKMAGSECFDDFCIAACKGKDGSEFSLTFKKKGDSFVFFNERSGFAQFGKVYALGYAVDGGKIRIRFNGKRSPLIYEMETSGAVSFINSALKNGENEITLEPAAAGSKARVSIRISSAAEGGIINSSQGDVLAWDVEVADTVSRKFFAE